ncbi:chemotaxis protein CheW [Silvimonas sp. JCM 19000]
MTNATTTYGAAWSASDEYLIFALGQEEYGLDIHKVQEIRGYDAVTRIANTPDFIKGVINLRGTIAPIVDLRIKFGLGEVRYDDFTVVIILNVADRVIGIVVDGVSDVTTLPESSISAMPSLGSSIDQRFLVGLGTLDERMVILLDIERLMTSDEMQLVEPAAA